MGGKTVSNSCYLNQIWRSVWKLTPSWSSFVCKQAWLCKATQKSSKSPADIFVSTTLNGRWFARLGQYSCLIIWFQIFSSEVGMETSWNFPSYVQWHTNMNGQQNQKTSQNRKSYLTFRPNSYRGKCKFEHAWCALESWARNTFSLSLQFIHKRSFLHFSHIIKFFSLKWQEFADILLQE